MRLQTLPANIRLGWKGLKETNTLAHYCTQLISVITKALTLLTNIRLVWKDATTLSISTFSIPTLSIMGLVTSLSINDTQLRHSA